MFWGDFSFLSGRYSDELGKLRQLILDNLVLGDYATQTAGAARDQFCKVEQLAAPDPVPIAPDEPKPALPAFAIGDPALQVQNHIEVSEGPRYQHTYKYLDAVVPDAAQAIIQAEMWVEAHLPAVGELVAEYEMLSTKKMRLADGTALATWDSRVYNLEQSETVGGNDPRNVSILAGHYAAGAFWSEVYAEVETFWKANGDRASESFKIPVLLYDPGHDMRGMHDMAHDAALLSAGKAGELVGTTDFDNLRTSFTLYGDGAANQGPTTETKAEVAARVHAILQRITALRASPSPPPRD